MASGRLHTIVRGRVQGVGFRATTQHEARRRGLTGWVRNLADGTVEVVTEGDEAVLEEFLDYLRRGPRGAHVDAVDAQWLTPQGDLVSPFQVRRTE